MVVGALRHCDADIAVSVTGVAGPTGWRRRQPGRHRVVRVGAAHRQRHSGGADRAPRLSSAIANRSAVARSQPRSRACSPVSLRRDRFPTLPRRSKNNQGESEMAATDALQALREVRVRRRSLGASGLSSRLRSCSDHHSRNARHASVGDPLRRPRCRGRHDGGDAEPVRVAGTRSNDGARGRRDAEGDLRAARIQRLGDEPFESDRRLVSRARAQDARASAVATASARSACVSPAISRSR